MKNKILSIALAVVLVMLALAPIGVGAAAPTDVPLPSLTADSNNASYTGSDDSIVYYYTGVKKDNYNSYITTLTNAGYTTVQTYDADSCYYALMDNGTNTVFVSFLKEAGTSFFGGSGANGRLRVFVQESGTEYHTQKTATEASVCSPMLWQLDVDTMVGDTGGMSYVIRLSDGTFVIIDGGYNTDAEANNLYSILKANNPLEGNPVISAWFVSHMHIDHYGILYSFSRLYADRVTVKGFYYNFPGSNVGDIYVNNITGIENNMKKWEGAKLYSKIHSGMVMGFAGATVEVLSTHEDIRQSYYHRENVLSGYSLTENDFEAANDTSTVIRVNIAGQSIMFLADAQDGVGDSLLNTHTTSYLRSNIMQMAHHGFSNGVSYKVIETINPKVILWPMDIVQYVDGEMIEGVYGDTKSFVHYYDLDNEYVKSAKSCASEIIPAYRNDALSLPYTANTIYKSETADYNTLKAQKASIANASKGVYIQKSNDGRSIRLIGVLNVTEEQLEEYESVGFDVILSYNGRAYRKTITTKTVYTSIIANGETVYASEYSGTHFYAVEITDLDTAEGNVEFILSGTVTTADGTTLNNGTAVYTLTPQLKAGETGDVVIFDFSDIIAGEWKEVGAN